MVVIKSKIFKVAILCPTLNTPPATLTITLKNHILFMCEAMLQALGTHPEISKSEAGVPRCHTMFTNPSAVVKPFMFVNDNSRLPVTFEGCKSQSPPPAKESSNTTSLKRSFSEWRSVWLAVWKLTTLHGASDVTHKFPNGIMSLILDHPVFTNNQQHNFCFRRGPFPTCRRKRVNPGFLSFIDSYSIGMKKNRYSCSVLVCFELKPCVKI